MGEMSCKLKKIWSEQMKYVDSLKEGNVTSYGDLLIEAHVLQAMEIF